MTVPNPTFLLHFHQEPALQNDNPLNTSISRTFSPIGFETKNRKQKSFCRHESLQPHLRYASVNGVGAASTTK